MTRTGKPASVRLSAGDGEIVAWPGTFQAEDAPHWLDRWSPEFYAQRRNEEIEQARREMSRSYRHGGTAEDWINQAADYLRTIADGSPVQGSLHHTLMIISGQLHKIVERGVELGDAS